MSCGTAGDGRRGDGARDRHAGATGVRDRKPVDQRLRRRLVARGETLTVIALSSLLLTRFHYLFVLIVRNTPS